MCEYCKKIINNKKILDKKFFVNKPIMTTRDLERSNT